MKIIRQSFRNLLQRLCGPKESKEDPEFQEKFRFALANLPPEADSGPLKEEICTLRLHLAEVLRHHGEYVIISGNDILGYYDSFSRALEVGYKRVGLDRVFLTHEVDELTRPPIRLRPWMRPVTLAEAAS